jgi:molybdopterin-guanine dinucleotide biosynthesis protein A
MDPPGEPRAGVVLAGGYSERFGDDEKALADLDGTPLLVRAVDGLAPAVAGVVVNGRPDQVPAFRAALTGAAADVAFVPDRTPDRGPAAGLATALAAVRAPAVAVVACDMPLVDGAFLATLFESMGDADGAVPYVDGQPQPTHAVFRTDPARRAARDAVENGNGSLRGVLDRLDVVDLPESRVLAETSRRSFTDVDTPEALAEARRDG